MDLKVEYDIEASRKFLTLTPDLLLGVSGGCYQRGFPIKIVYAFLASLIQARYPVHYNFLDFNVLTMLAKATYCLSLNPKIPTVAELT
jgi:hypothetical protein